MSEQRRNCPSYRESDDRNHDGYKKEFEVGLEYVRVAVTLSRHPDREARYTQEVVGEFNRDRFYRTPKFGRYENGVTGHGQEDGQNGGSDAQNPVNGLEMHRFHSTHEHHAGNDEDQAEGKRDGVVSVVTEVAVVGRSR